MDFKGLVQMMVDADLERLTRHRDASEPSITSLRAATGPEPFGNEGRDPCADRQRRGQPRRVDARGLHHARIERVALDQEVRERLIGPCSLARMPVPPGCRSASVIAGSSAARVLDERLERQPVALVVVLAAPDSRIVGPSSTLPHVVRVRCTPSPCPGVRQGIDEPVHPVAAAGASSAYSPRHG